MSDLREALEAAKEKLQLYRAEHCGVYVGGVEYSALMKRIDAALAQPQNDLLQDDLREMLRALGMFDGAQPKSPHEVFQAAIAEMKRQLSAQPQNDAEAVAWVEYFYEEGGGKEMLVHRIKPTPDETTIEILPLYTAPPSPERMRETLSRGLIGDRSWRKDEARVKCWDAEAKADAILALRGGE